MVRAYCISLREREDRREMVDRQFRKGGVDVEFLLVDRDPSNPERGCFESHRLVAERAKSMQQKAVMVFEDDVVFDRKISDLDFRNIEHLSNCVENWDILYLGGLLGELWPTNRLGVAGCSLMCAHAYVLSASGIDKLLSKSYSGMPVDVVYALEFKALSVFPLAVSQMSVDSVKSDIANFAGRDGLITDKVWRSNSRRQYFSLLKGLLKFEVLPG